jgi:hypothetical protein
MRMRICLILLIAVFLSGTPGLARTQPKNAEYVEISIEKDGGAGEQKAQEKKPIFACNLLALKPDERKRHSEVTKQMRGVTKEKRELADGYGFRFPSDQSTILLVSEFVARERLCCPFFTFEMVVEPEDGPLWLRLRGAEGVKKFIRVEFGMN